MAELRVLKGREPEKVEPEKQVWQYFCNCHWEPGEHCWPHFSLYYRDGEPGWMPVCTMCGAEIEGAPGSVTG